MHRCVYSRQIKVSDIYLQLIRNLFNIAKLEFTIKYCHKMCILNYVTKMHNKIYHKYIKNLLLSMLSKTNISENRIYIFPFNYEFYAFNYIL